MSARLFHAVGTFGNKCASHLKLCESARGALHIEPPIDAHAPPSPTERIQNIGIPKMTPEFYISVARNPGSPSVGDFFLRGFPRID